MSSKHFLNLPETQIEQTWLKKQRNNFRTEIFKSDHSAQLSQELADCFNSAVLQKQLRNSIYFHFLSTREEVESKAEI